MVWELGVAGMSRLTSRRSIGGAGEAEQERTDRDAAGRDATGRDANGGVAERMSNQGGSIAISGAGYAGDVSAAECWQALGANPDAMLVDVRTDAEWSYVGLPDLTGINKSPVRVSWQVFPSMQLNERFVADVAAQCSGRERPIYFLCRSGVRSRAAAVAMTEAGWTSCYNILGGFEGDLDAERHRGRLGGWKAAGLPWRQS